MWWNSFILFLDSYVMTRDSRSMTHDLWFMTLSQCCREFHVSCSWFWMIWLMTHDSCLFFQTRFDWIFWSWSGWQSKWLMTQSQRNRGFHTWMIVGVHIPRVIPRPVYMYISICMCVVCVFADTIATYHPPPPQSPPPQHSGRLGEHITPSHRCTATAPRRFNHTHNHTRTHAYTHTHT